MLIKQKFPCSLNTFVKHVLMRRFAGALLECLGEVEEIQAGNRCQVLQFEVISQVSINVFEHSFEILSRETTAICVELRFSGRVVLGNVGGERYRNRLAEERSARRTCRYVGAQ